MNALQTEQVTINTQIVPGRMGTATFWIVYPMTPGQPTDVETRIANARGVGPTASEALRDAARR